MEELKNKKVALISIGFVVLVILASVLTISFRGSLKQLVVPAKEGRPAVVVEQEGGTLTVFQSGRVEFRDKDGNLFVDQWSADKVASFLKLMEDSYLSGEETEAGAVGSITFYNGTTKTVLIDQDDELIDVVIDETTGDDDDGDTGNGDDISDFFGTPTPTNPGSTPPPGGPTYTSAPSGIPEGCIHWKLSYCAKWQQTPTPVPSPSGDDAVLPPTCEDAGNRQTGRTTISNENCIPEE